MRILLKFTRIVGDHSHTSDPSKPVADKVKLELRIRSNNSAVKIRSSIGEAVKNSILLAWRLCHPRLTYRGSFAAGMQKENVVPHIPQERTIFEIPLLFRQ